MMKSVFWDVTPFSPLKSNLRFVQTRRLHLQGRAKQETNIKQAAVCPKHRLIFNELHGVISQNREVFICTAVKTYHPECTALPSSHVPPFLILLGLFNSAFIQLCRICYTPERISQEAVLACFKTIFQHFPSKIGANQEIPKSV
jgi:hypothetical protein